MKKHPTLEELVKERGLKPADCEKKDGRFKSSNGYSVVLIYENGKYITVYPDTSKEVLHTSTATEHVLVRG